MPNITIAVPAELKKEMDKLAEVNWSAVTREFLADKVKRLALLKKMDKMLESSELTDEDCIRLAGKRRNLCISVFRCGEIACFWLLT